MGKKCGRCSTRYCGPECQVQHWKEGGHDQLCKKIKKGGGMEQYHANKKYKEAVAVAAEKCAEDTKGQTCYICTQALHWKTKEGLVRGCSCRGTAGFAHVSCLAEQAKILMDEAEANNLGGEARDARWHRWDKCSQCEQMYHGVVSCAFGWACWKTYVGRAETHWTRRSAMTCLAIGLNEAGQHEERLRVMQQQLVTEERIGGPEMNHTHIRSNVASCYLSLGRMPEALGLYREVYATYMRLCGSSHKDTCIAAINVSATLRAMGNVAEAAKFTRKILPEVTRVFGADSDVSLKLNATLAQALYLDEKAPPEHLREAVEILEPAIRISQRILGGQHPLTKALQGDLAEARRRVAWGSRG